MVKIVVVKVKMPQFAIFTGSEFWPHFDQKERFGNNGVVSGLDWKPKLKCWLANHELEEKHSSPISHLFNQGFEVLWKYASANLTFIMNILQVGLKTKRIGIYLLSLGECVPSCSAPVGGCASLPSACRRGGGEETQEP